MYIPAIIVFLLENGGKENRKKFKEALSAIFRDDEFSQSLSMVAKTRREMEMEEQEKMKISTKMTTRRR